MKFDLHFHTTLSDGMKTPEEVVKIAQEQNMWFLACTDHDLINTRFTELAKLSRIEAIDWVELSSSDYDNNAKAAHLTCYSRKFQGRIFSILDGIQEARQTKILLQIEKLLKWGFHIEKEAFFSYWEKQGSSLGNLNNGHLREYLFFNPRNTQIAEEKMGNAFNKATFIRRALSKSGDFAHIGSIENLPPYEPSVGLCGELARQNNAILSIAHPNHTFDSIQEFQKLVPSYVEKWVNALEIHYSTSPEWIKVILETREKFNLLLTFGSDCHFENGNDKHGMIGDLNPHLKSDFIEKEFQKFREAL